MVGPGYHLFNLGSYLCLSGALTDCFLPLVHFCETILNKDHWLKRYHLKIFLIYSSGGHFVRQSGTICAILIEIL